MLKRAVINVRSTDNACFAWSVVAALHPAQKHVDSESSYPHYCRKECVPFIVYADLECVLEKMDNDSQSATHMYQHHNVFSIGYYVHCSYDSSLSGYRFRRDKDCIAWFAEELKNLAHSVQSIISANVRHDGFHARRLKNLTSPHIVTCARNRFLPEHIRADSEVQRYHRCLKHYNLPSHQTHINGPAPLIKNCGECHREAC
ncbi:hypothetical protein ALC60_04434 [Trachymyrmex zeteki]|uniref:Uncharacterized protein n=1 Tax=Mycetomoellerius zeteki TaxID=64791 RepID=A0A151X8E1_9HYME|nr:hypothetical protein ALC60_04434 [Trachymyrmex zeteki]